MALNPPLTYDGLPLKVSGEVFVLSRQHMEIEVKIKNNNEFGKKTGKGMLYMTSCRLVFVHKDHATNPFKSFDIPLQNLIKESFEQPVFGANYLKGDVLPLYNLIPGVAQFKLWFKAGGCAVFLKMIDSVLSQVRRNRNSRQQGPDQRFLDEVQSGNIGNNQALFDPSDPTTIYVTQPASQQMEQQQQGQYYGNNTNPNPYYQNSQPPPQQNQNQNQNQFQQYQPPPQQQQQNQNQFQQYQPPPQQQQNNGQFQQYQPTYGQQNPGQFQQYNPDQFQYQNNPNQPQNYQQSDEQLQQQQQINQQPQPPQPQEQKKYFGFFGPTLANNNQQQNQFPPQQEYQQPQAYHNQPQPPNQQNQQNQNNNNNNYQYPPQN